MPEFLMSRTMLAVVGVIVVGLAVGGISALDAGNAVSLEQQVADSLAGEITKVASSGGCMMFVLRVDDFLPVGDWSIELTNDTITTIHSGMRCYAMTGCSVVIDGGTRTAVSHGSIIVTCPSDRRTAAIVYVVNVDDIRLTAPTNFLQSCKSL